MVDDAKLTDRVRTANGDAWQAEGMLRAPYGGGAEELPGIRLMSSGIPVGQWNSGDVTNPELVDLDAVRAWYAKRDVPWGVRVPAELSWPHGRHLFRKRCMALLPEATRSMAPPSPEIELRLAGPDDLETFARVDAAAFGEDHVGPTIEWTRPHLSAPGCHPLIAELDREPVGVATGVLTSGAAGRSVAIFGVGVLPPARRRGIATALAASIVDWGSASRADLAWLNPDSEDAARLYRRMGFVETGGFDIYVEH